MVRDMLKVPVIYAYQRVVEPEVVQIPFPFSVLLCLATLCIIPAGLWARPAQAWTV